MRRLSLLLLVMVLVLAVPVAAEERVTVFRDLAWGDPVEALGRFRLHSDDDRLKTYVKVGEDHMLGPVNAFRIFYDFFDGQLAAISVGSQDRKELGSLVEARYGKPDYDDHFSQKVWFSVGDDTGVIFKDQFDHAAMILFSNTLHDERTMWRDEQEAAEAKSAW